MKQRYRDDLNSYKWKATRERVVHKAMGICEYCLQEGVLFEVHHEKYVGSHPSSTPDKFLKSICPQCHDLKHWNDRLAAYTQRKRELLNAGVLMTQELNEKLIQEFRV